MRPWVLATAITSRLILKFRGTSGSSLGGQMADADIRPMSLGEVLDRTFQLYKNHFWLFAGITALPFSLLLIAQIAVAAMSSVPARAPVAHTASFSPGLVGGMV